MNGCCKKMILGINGSMTWFRMARVKGPFLPASISVIRCQTTEAAKTESEKLRNAPESRPLLFIAKYNETVDTERYNVDGWTTEAPDDRAQTDGRDPERPEGLTQNNVDFLVKAVKQADSFSHLSNTLKSSEKVSVASEEFKPVKLNVKELPSYYMKLSKARLTLLVAVTSAGGFGLAPYEVFEPQLLFYSTLGVILTSACANSINQYMEVPFDSQMNRTKNRVLVRGYLSPRHALGFALGSGIVGAAVLGSLVNSTAMCLGVANIFLYTCAYTPMKRLTIGNTWVGSIVGAIPPLIGWASAMGGELGTGAFILAGVMYAWQFPHFNALSWNLRPDYSRAGYRMMAVTNPDLCCRTTLRYSIALIGICSFASPLLNVTTPAFAVESLPLNLYLTFLSWKFYRDPDSASSRKLFRFTLIHLPLLMTLLYIGKTRKENSMENLKFSE